MHILSCRLDDDGYKKTVGIQRMAIAQAEKADIAEFEVDSEKQERFRSQIQFQFIVAAYEALETFVVSTDPAIIEFLTPLSNDLHDQLEKLSVSKIAVGAFEESDRIPQMIIRGTTVSDTLIDYKLWNRLSERDRKAAALHHLLLLTLIKINQTQPTQNRQMLHRIFAK